MTDVALRFNNELFLADLALLDGALATDDGLKTAVIISLFSDARARDDDPLPAPGDRRGWWGDAFPTERDDRIGSRLWLLAREKRLPAVLRRAEDYAKESLAWLVDDEIARAIVVEADAPGLQTLRLKIEIYRPETAQPQRFDFTWEATADAV